MSDTVGLSISARIVERDGSARSYSHVVPSRRVPASSAKSRSNGFRCASDTLSAHRTCTRGANGEGVVVRAVTLPANMTMLTAANATIGPRSPSPWTPLKCIGFSRGYHAATLTVR